MWLYLPFRDCRNVLISLQYIKLCSTYRNKIIRPEIIEGFIALVQIVYLVGYPNKIINHKILKLLLSLIVI